MRLFACALAVARGTCAPVSEPCCGVNAGLSCVYPNGCRRNADGAPSQYGQITGSSAACQAGSPVLAQHFLNQGRALVPRAAATLSPGALRRLEAHAWPGLSRTFAVTIAVREGRSTGRLVIRDASGAERRREMSAASCGAIVSALALVIALDLDPGSTGPVAEPSAPPTATPSDPKAPERTGHGTGGSGPGA